MSLNLYLSEVGTATAGTDNTLTDSTKSWPVGSLIGEIIELLDGSGDPTEERAIASNTETQITVTEDWDSNPGNTDPYRLLLFIDDDRLDKIKETVVSGATLLEETIIFLKNSNRLPHTYDNPLLTYEGIEIRHIEKEWQDDHDYAIGQSVPGTDTESYMCINPHTSSNATRPITGGSWADYWVLINSVVVEYAEDDGAGDPDTYGEPLSLADGSYVVTTPIHRKFTSTNVELSFRSTHNYHRTFAAVEHTRPPIALGIGETQDLPFSTVSDVMQDHPTYILAVVEGNLIYHASAWRR